MRNKILFACRSGASASFIARHLYNAELLDAIIIESGNKAQKRKLERIKRNTKWWQWPSTLLNLLFLLLFSKAQSIAIRNFVYKEIGTVSFPDNVVSYYVDDINDDDCLEILNKEKPHTLVVYGTSILKDEVINIPYNYILNIHNGIVPKYRNVHSELWAYINRDFLNIGVTIMHLDSGIDTGDIAAQERLDVDEICGIFDVKVRNLQLSSQLIVDTLMNANTEMMRIPQDKAEQGFYPTPKAIQLLMLLFVTISRKIRFLTNKKRL